MVFFEDLMREIPPITKVLCGGSVLIQLLVYLEAITKYDIYFNLNLILTKFQVLFRLNISLNKARSGDYSPIFYILEIQELFHSLAS